MTAKLELVQPKNKFNVNKDKLSLSSSIKDHDIHSLLPNGNKDNSLTIMVTGTSSDKSTESSVISLENIRYIFEEKPLNTEHTGHTGRDYAKLSSKDSCMTMSVAKLSTKYRKNKGISKRLQYRKRRSANRNSRLFSHSLWIVCVVMSILQAENVECSDSVTWNVKTKPILFGETLELVCKIYDEKNVCKGSFQQWYGSKQDTLLCQDGKCRNEAKYTFKKNANCTNSLLIHNLSISDVDISYSCAFGRNEMKKGLMMKDYEFLKLPRNNSASPSLTINDSIVDVSLKINDIYPKPNCTIILHEKDITEKANIASTFTPDGIFFTYTMHIMHAVSKKDCGSPLIVSCYIGSFPVTNFSKELDNCTDFTSDPWIGNNSTLVISMIILTTVTAVVICLVIYVLINFYRTKSRDKEKHTKQEARETTKWIPVGDNNSETAEGGHVIPLEAMIGNKAKTDDTRESCSEMSNIADTNERN